MRERCLFLGLTLYRRMGENNERAVDSAETTHFGFA